VGDVEEDQRLVNVPGRSFNAIAPFSSSSLPSLVGEGGSSSISQTRISWKISSLSQPANPIGSLPPNVLFRIVLFKLFISIKAWELLTTALGPLTWRTFSVSSYGAVLDKAKAQGVKVWARCFSDHEINWVID
jgi:alpha-glutamyl/putrescinyl thymine pyrophosphorylase clade 1